MDNNLAVLRRALEDPKLEDLPCICPSHIPQLISVLKELPPDACVSEWRYGMGDIRYEYRVHGNGAALQLREAFSNGARGGHPTLTAVYSREELERLIQQ